MPTLSPLRALRGSAAVAAIVLLLAGCSSAPVPAASNISEASSADPDALLPSAEGETAYPLTLESPYGETVIEERPTRIATVGANAQAAELVIALGGIPVTAAGLGFNKSPWLVDIVGDRIETVFETESWDEYPLETLAAAQPDVIVAFGYDLTDHFDELSAIAPVVTSAEPWTGYFSNPWQDNITILGEALDLPSAAAQVIDDYDAYTENVREEHPEFDDKTLSYTVWFGSERGLSYQSLPDSIISDVFSQIGFRLADGADEFTELQTVSDELIAEIDADALIIAGSDGGTDPVADAIPGLTDSSLFQGLTAWQDGHVVITEDTSPVG